MGTGAAAVLLLAVASGAGTGLSRRGEVPSRYDFIVVGGGTAGCVVAGRLAELPEARVLVVERGPADYSAVHVPAQWLQVLLNEPTRDIVTSAGQVTLGGRQIVLFWGRGFGGSATHNLMGMVRGSPRDYEAWDTLLGGGTDWNWSTALEYFKKSEYYDGPGANQELRGTDPDHPFPVSEVPYKSSLSQSFFEAAQRAGYVENPDYNSDLRQGVSWMQANVRKGRRVTTCGAYLARDGAGDRVTLLTESRVDRITFDRSGPEPAASGVIYTRAGAEESAELADGGEVLLAASAFYTPKILMLSGVGPREDLEHFGIEVLVDLPGVGRGLHDHSATALGFRLNPSVTKDGVAVPTLPRAATADPEQQARFMAEWELGTGPYTTTGHEVTLFLTSPWANELHPVKGGGS